MGEECSSQSVKRVQKFDIVIQQKMFNMPGTNSSAKQVC